MRELVFPQLVRNRKRFDEIIRTLAKYGLADWVREWDPEFVKDRFRASEGRKISEMTPGVRLLRSIGRSGGIQPKD
jgi:ubiquinone biosynthesis protein